jgi:hypothetical protein
LFYRSTGRLAVAFTVSRPRFSSYEVFMSAFSDLWNETAAPLLTEQYAGEALCTQPDTLPQSVAATIWPLEITEDRNQRGVIRNHRRLLGVPRTASAANGGGFLENPGIDDVWNIEGVDFSVEAIESRTESETILRLLRVATHEETRDGLRRRN